MKRNWILVGLIAAAGCSTTYYAVAQKFGYEKRDILVNRVEDVRTAQTDAKKQFASTFDEFKALTNFNGGNLEAEYKKLKAGYDSCKTRADTVSARIAKVDDTANRMFKEWEDNLATYHDAKLRADSQQSLSTSKSKYQQLLVAMKKSEASMKPVLDIYEDKVHILNDSLNAAAIDNLKNTSAEVSTDVQNLIRDMDASINEANSFIDGMKKS